MATIDHEQATSDCRTRHEESSEPESDQVNMKNQKERLVEMIESEFGLLDKLMKIGAMTHNKCEQIQCESTRHKMNEMILKHVLRENKHQELIEALLESGQTHVVNWIRSNGEYREEFALDWPLTERDIELLDVNQEELVDLLDTSELLSKLYSQKVINVRQREFVDSTPVSHRRNEVLLGIIRRFSRKSYFTVITCLKESNQSHVADILEHIRILENGGVIVRVHVALKCDNLNEAKKQIAEEMTHLLTHQDVSKVEAERLLTAFRLQIVGVKCGDDVVIYVCCSKTEEFLQLCKRAGDSERKNILEQLFNVLLSGVRVQVLEMCVSAKDMFRARQSFQVLESRKERLETNVSNTTLENSKERKLQESKSTVSAKAKKTRKVVFVGQSFCGKTCLVFVIKRKKFPPQLEATMSCEVTEVNIDIDGQEVELQIWDTGGHEAYDNMRMMYYRLAHVIILCFAIDCRESFEMISSEWATQVRLSRPDVPLILVGNKKDLLQDKFKMNKLRDMGLRPVTPEEGQAMAHEIGAVAYLECSALSGEGVREVQEMAARVSISVDDIPAKEKLSKRINKRCTIA